ncbi:hypothetical protein UB31_21270 [Bradyrhizobium sp. LTSP849]|uniref:hypothetical protein n=1 Tax=Bradyrhizobium sp. LTSP849 TaxID=1615890 RepID=UPI0005D2C8D3|nr:hypothetical protein [Bradyrhizobium sp. LTSP849]KJC44109.1 hypothetical protein UB31_21270 [Bradyrhizobium sp. LTSP849]
MTPKNHKVSVRGADGELHALALVRLEGEVAYCCSEAKYEEAIRHPEACIEVGFPLADVKMKEAAN